MRESLGTPLGTPRDSTASLGTPRESIGVATVPSDGTTPAGPSSQATEKTKLSFMVTALRHPSRLDRARAAAQACASSSRNQAVEMSNTSTEDPAHSALKLSEADDEGPTDPTIRATPSEENATWMSESIAEE
jgi:hypothetical protein